MSCLLVTYLQIGVMMTGRRARSQPLMLRGTLFTLRRRCGKPTCHCAGGDAHESPALAYPEAGKTKTLTLAAGEVAAVRAALERYQRARGELDAAADAGVAALRTAATERRGHRRR
jgi:hypothetical protein